MCDGDGNEAMNWWDDDYNEEANWCDGDYEETLDWCDEQGNEIFKCLYCARKSADVQRCSRCKEAIYCNQECQKAHWKIHKADCVEQDILIEVHPVNNTVYVRPIAEGLAAEFGARLHRAEMGYITLRCESKQQRDGMESLLIIYKNIPFLATASGYGPLCQAAQEALAKNVAKRRALRGPETPKKNAGGLAKKPKSRRLR